MTLIPNLVTVDLVSAIKKKNNTKLSVVIITKNEETNLSRILPSLSFADEVVILDCGSTDRTIEIANFHGAQVFVEAWKGFGLQKRQAVTLARNDWILSVDADEFIDEALQIEIQQTLSAENLILARAFKIPRISFFLNKWIKHGGWHPDYQLRLFNRQVFNWNSSEIHEKVVANQNSQDIEIKTLRNSLKHYVFSDLTHQINTNNRYSSLLAQQDFLNGKGSSILSLTVKPWIKFIECYFLKLGFLDGKAGYIIAANAAYSIFLRKVKLWEHQSKK